MARGGTGQGPRVGLLPRSEGGVRPSPTSFARPSAWFCSEKDLRGWSEPLGKVIDPRQGQGQGHGQRSRDRTRLRA